LFSLRLMPIVQTGESRRSVAPRDSPPGFGAERRRFGAGSASTWVVRLTGAELSALTKWLTIAQAAATVRDARPTERNKLP
jgi:hypothetical protein